MYAMTKIIKRQNCSKLPNNNQRFRTFQYSEQKAIVHLFLVLKLFCIYCSMASIYLTHINVLDFHTINFK